MQTVKTKTQNETVRCQKQYSFTNCQTMVIAREQVKLINIQTIHILLQCVSNNSLIVYFLIAILAPVYMRDTTVNSKPSTFVNTNFPIKNHNPFEGGYDIDGQKLYICRTQKYGQLIPGKYSVNIGKCSISRNRKEIQYSQFDILVQSKDTRYEWIELKKPVTELPENVLLAGRRLRLPVKLPFKTNQTQFDSILTNNLASLNKKRRFRRSIPREWSPNWRGDIKPVTELMRKVNFSMQNLTVKAKCNNRNLNRNNCSSDRQKHSYFIAKCLLRTGNITSEQIGKIWWNENIQEWIAAFPFGGNEIYCLDYSILAVKSS